MLFATTFAKSRDSEDSNQPISPSSGKRERSSSPRSAVSPFSTKSRHVLIPARYGRCCSPRHTPNSRTWWWQLSINVKLHSRPLQKRRRCLTKISSAGAGGPKAQHDEELKNIIFVVFYESDTRMQGNEDKHAVLPTSAEVMTAATDAPRMEQAIVMLVAHAMVSYRAPSIRQSYTLAVATKEEASRNADADAIAEERNKRYAPANAVMVKLNAVLFDPPATPDGNATGSGGKKASSRNTAARKPQK